MGAQCTIFEIFIQKLSGHKHGGEGSSIITVKQKKNLNNKGKIDPFENFVHPEFRILTWSLNIGNMFGSVILKSKSTLSRLQFAENLQKLPSLVNSNKCLKLNDT